MCLYWVWRVEGRACNELFLYTAVLHDEPWNFTLGHYRVSVFHTDSIPGVSR